MWLYRKPPKGPTFQILAEIWISMIGILNGTMLKTDVDRRLLGPPTVQQNTGVLLTYYLERNIGASISRIRFQASIGYTYGWLSKLWSLFGYPKYQVPYYIRDPRRDHNFDHRPYTLYDTSISIPDSPERDHCLPPCPLECKQLGHVLKRIHNPRQGNH